jgi:hypothetical protein
MDEGMGGRRPALVIASVAGYRAGRPSRVSASRINRMSLTAGG